MSRGPDRRPFPGRVVPRERWTRTRVALPQEGTFDWRATFGRDAPRVLDLGCGNGRFLIGSALARPNRDHLGVDLVPPAIRHASRRAGQRGLTNCRFGWGDAGAFLDRVEPGSVAEVHLYHPQPHFDPAHVGRRQLGPHTLAAIHAALERGGLFVFQTDNAAYASYARRVVPSLFAWEELDGPWPDAPHGRTDREIRARARGLAIVRVRAMRLDLDEDEVRLRVARLPDPAFDANRRGHRGRVIT
jgi:tRNA (guanine-N7-)-methyltransferase